MSLHLILEQATLAKCFKVGGLGEQRHEESAVAEQRWLRGKGMGVKVKLVKPKVGAEVHRLLNPVICSSSRCDLRGPRVGMGLQRRWAVGRMMGQSPQAAWQDQHWWWVLTGSPLGPCSPLKPAIPGSPLTKERGRFSHWVPFADPAPTSRNPQRHCKRTVM